jgi:tetratricopeptide (TPR) repeat protein
MNILSVRLLRGALFLSTAICLIGNSNAQLNSAVQPKETRGWGDVWQRRMTIGQAALDDAFKLAQQGKINDALVMVDQVIATNPSNWRAYFLKAAVLTLAKRQAEALQLIDTSIRLARKDNVSAALLAQLYESKGRSCIDFGRFPEARQSLEAAVKLQPNDPGTLNDLAWMLATSHDGRIRNGRKAVALALKSCALSRWTNAFAIDTLAAAYAETGDFANAQKYQSWAMQQLDAEDRKAQLSGMEERLKLYQSRSAFHG